MYGSYTQYVCGDDAYINICNRYLKYNFTTYQGYFTFTKIQVFCLLKSNQIFAYKLLKKK